MKKIFLFVFLLLLQVNVFGSTERGKALDRFQSMVCDKMIDLLEKNIVEEKEVTALFKGIKGDETVEDRVITITEKITNLCIGHDMATAALRCYGYCKLIKSYSDVILEKFRVNHFVDDSMISEITKFNKLEDHLYETTLNSVLEAPGCTLQDPKKLIEGYLREYNKKQVMTIFEDIFSRHFSLFFLMKMKRHCHLILEE